MNRIKTNRINYYFLLSLLIHSSMFLFIEKKKDVTLGQKIIPIEVYDNLLETGFGESTKRNNKLIKRTSSKEESQKEKKYMKSSDELKSSEDNKINRKIEKKIDERNKAENNNFKKAFLEDSAISGSKEGIKKNEPEKGSLKGKGTLKVTCLKCVRPIYPPIALRRGAEGTPKVKVWINKNGNVVKVKLLNLSGNESIDNAAKKAAINSTFYPLVEETSINIEYDLKIR